jgi:hypothetical protein
MTTGINRAACYNRPHGHPAVAVLDQASDGRGWTKTAPWPFRCLRDQPPALKPRHCGRPREKTETVGTRTQDLRIKSRSEFVSHRVVSPCSSTSCRTVKIVAKTAWQSSVGAVLDDARLVSNLCLVRDLHKICTRLPRQELTRPDCTSACGRNSPN